MERRLPFYKDDTITLYCDDRTYFQQSVEEHRGDTAVIPSLVSVTPRSSTWANHYFWAVLEALWHASDTILPYQNFYSFGHTRKVAVGVGHCHAPAARSLMPSELSTQDYPTIAGYNYFLNVMKVLANEAELLANPDFRPVLVYRNPQDQITSYCRGLWGAEYDYVDEIKVVVQQEGASPRAIRNVSEFIREGGAQAICYYIRSFIDLQQRLGDRVMLLPYECFIENRVRACTEMVNHILAGTGIEVPDDMIQVAAQVTDRAHLSEFEKTRNLGLSHWHDRNAPGALRDGKAVLHVIDGNVGQWQGVLSQGDIDYIKSTMERFKLDPALFTFDPAHARSGF